MLNIELLNELLPISITKDFFSRITMKIKNTQYFGEKTFYHGLSCHPVQLTNIFFLFGDCIVLSNFITSKSLGPEFLLQTISTWKKRELIALLNLSSWWLVMVERLFLAVPLGCLRFVIVIS